MNRNIKYFIFIMLGVLALFLLFKQQDTFSKGSPTELKLSEFRQMLTREGQAKLGRIYTRKSPYKDNRKKKVDPFVLRISDKRIEGRYLAPTLKIEESDDEAKILSRTKEFFVKLNQNSGDSEKLLARLDKLGIIYITPTQEDNGIFQTVLSMLPIILIIGLLWIFMMRQIQSTGNRAMAFGKSKARLSSDSKKKVTFNDVAGCDEAKTELVEVVDFLKDPKKFHAIGARIPTGVLLVGPPGTGKTLLARAIAGEAGVPFYTISGSDFVEMFVGVGASRVRDLFEQAKKNAPCIVFIDEIDAVGRLRGAGLGGGHDEREQTLNQMLVEMDGFEENEGVIVIAATNRPDVLDPALLRPGRFDRQVVVDAPDVVGREAILKIHAKKVPLTSDVSLNAIARGTPGFTGADLENLVNEAALITARRNKLRVTQDEMEEAKDKVMMGPERRSFLISPKEKEVIAYHEAGHAILGTLLPHSEPVHKVTIIPRGRALGLTQQLPEGDKHIQPKKYWEDRICVYMGGYIAEELIFDDTATGASNDIQMATNIARRMVCEWGMSERLGTINYSDSNESVFLGREISNSRHYSDDTAASIDEEVKRIIQEQLDRGRSLIRENHDKLEKMAKALLVQETLTGGELNDILGIRSSNFTPTGFTSEDKEKQNISADSSTSEGRETAGGTPEPAPAT